jgi:nitroreductase
MQLLESLNWRYATKKFDSTKKVNAEDLDKLLEAIRLSASSYGLQLFKVLVVEDKETREKLKAAAWNQSQITDASQVIVFCSYSDVTAEDIDNYISRTAATRNLDVNALAQYADFMKGTILGLDANVKQAWTARQTYIALGTLLAACAELRIDSCPMEGFDNAQFDEILGLEAKGLKSAVVATIGYRSEEDQLQYAAKVRKSKEDLFETI